jgi:carboxyl-terminal processing protease
VHRPGLALLRATIFGLLSFQLACDPSDALVGKKAESAQSTGAESSAEVQDASGRETPEEIEAWMHLDTREFPLLIWSAQVVQSDYHATDRFDLDRQVQAALDSLAREVPEFFAERKGDKVQVRVGGKSREFDWPRGLSFRDGAAWLEPVLAFTRDQLKLEGEALHELEYATLNGYVAPLDPHTILLTPREHADLGVKTRGHFGGVGIRVYAASPYIVVEEVLPDMPAAKAGVLSGDLIVNIDGQSTVNMPIIEARDLLRGPQGSTVKIVVQREGKGKLPIAIERDVIRIASVQSHRLAGDVAYLRITTFQEDTAAKVGEALVALGEDKALAGVVLDLRGNAGGLLTQATALLDHLVGDGELVIVRSAMGREAQAAEKALTLGADVPVVAMVDEGSASAAEIVGGGIVHLGRGVVLGRTSFGKGTVQMLKPSAPYGKELGLKLTVAEYRVAGDTAIQSRGVTPDLQLLPVRLQEIAGVAAAYDDERFERERERHITAHLPSSHGDAPAIVEPAQSLRYLDRQWDAVEGEPAPMRDPEVRLAREVAAGLAGKGTRKAMLGALTPLAELMRTREDEAIAKGMDESWGSPPRWGGKAGQGGSAKMALVAKLVDSKRIRPGDPFSVELALTNEGSSPVERVHVVSDCEEDELDGIEYFFGTLGPGETRTETLHLAMSAWHPARHERLIFDAHVGEPDAKADASAELAVELSAPERPRLAFSYWIVDDPKAAKRAPARPKVDPRLVTEPFVIKGNGDGRLQPGEQALVAFEVHNLGPGMSEHSILRVRNLSRTQALLEEGELSLGKIAAGKVASGSIGLTVAPKADPAMPIEFAVIAGDAILRETVEGRVNFELGDQSKPAPRPERTANAMVLAPSFEVEDTPIMVATDRISIRGVASHVRRLKDVVVWVQGQGGPLTDQKLGYLANPVSDAGDPRSSTLAFEFDLPLVAGSNDISLIARDAEGIEARHDIAVYRSP